MLKFIFYSYTNPLISISILANNEEIADYILKRDHKDYEDYYLV